MKTLRNYFEHKKEELTPNENDFLAVLNKIEIKEKSAPIFVPRTSRVSIIQKFTFVVSAFAVLVVFINIQEVPKKIAEKQSISEAVSTIDSINSFDQ